ncbi:hypothetical protein ACFVJK_36855 [Streptomyces sp. NPDC127172]|uniref:hypothetical protein n=1 Tax=Streptomyces sp. NPDC127172 TaxID=3345382 RepID=UPI00364382A2
MTQPMRRLPWTDDGRDAYTPQGNGLINTIANAMEASMIATARADAKRARDLAEDPDASRLEMRTALRYLAHAVEDTALVADLRLERLPETIAPAGEVLWGSKAREIGEAHRGMIRNDNH